MAIKSQGTQMYIIDESGSEPFVMKVGCVTAIDGIDTTIAQNEITCLEDLARRYEAGLATPGNMTFGIQFDPTDDSHVKMHQLKVSGVTLKWAVGFSDGKDIPPTLETDSSGAEQFNLPTTRSWIAFEGFMTTFPFTFALNAVVTNSIGVQISGEPSVLPKAA